MYPHERSLVKQLADKPFVILGVNSDRDRDKLKTVMADENITWRSWFDGGSTGGPIASEWNVTGWPTIYLLDAQGVIRQKNVRGPSLDRAIEELLAEMGEEVKLEPEA
jgi:hypothetical protein